MSSSSSSSSHPNPFVQRPQGRTPSDSSSASSSWRSPHHSSKQHWAAGLSDMGQPFNPEMRDRQARGKDPYLPEAASSSSSSSSAGAAAASRQPKEPFHKTERRDWAETVLDNPELLMMYAQSSGDTLPATRLKFKKIMCGLDDDESDDAYSVQDMSRGLYQHQQHQQHQQRFGASTSSAGRGAGGARGGRR